MTLVAADVSPLHFLAISEPTHVGCYGPGVRGATKCFGEFSRDGGFLPAATVPMHLSGCAHQVGFACSGAASMRIYGVRSVVGTHELVMINRRNISRLLALLVAGALAMKASANGFRLADQDAFATARGEAFVATADNPSAIYYNPAGITQLEGNDLRCGIYGIYYDPSYTPTGQPYPHLPQFG